MEKIKNEPFYLKLDNLWYKKNDIVKFDIHGIEYRVLKVYKNIWWRRLLIKLGFKVKIMEIKIKTN